jgi:hypothetical protein
MLYLSIALGYYLIVKPLLSHYTSPNELFNLSSLGVTDVLQACKINGYFKADLAVKRPAGFLLRHLFRNSCANVLRSGRI